MKASHVNWNHVFLYRLKEKNVLRREKEHGKRKGDKLEAYESEEFMIRKRIYDYEMNLLWNTKLF